MLPLLLRRLETDALEIAGAELTLDQRRDLGLLSTCLTLLEIADTGLCTACGDPHEGAVIPPAPGSGSTRYHIRCPTLIRAPVSRASLERWRINPGHVAASIASALQVAGTIASDVPDRVWLLGRMTLGKHSYDVFFARGLAWHDGPSTIGAASRLLASRRALVIVPDAPPPSSVWNGAERAVCGLTAIADLGPDGIVIDRDHLARTIGIKVSRKTHPEIRSFPTPTGSTWSDVHITMGDDDRRDEVTVRIKGVTHTYTYRQAGFADGRSKQHLPNQQWAMLRAFAQEGGVIPLRSDVLASKEKTKQAIHAFREALKRWIPGIEGAPVNHDGDRDAYVCAFHVGSGGSTRFNLSAEIQSWEHIAIGIRGQEIVVVASTQIRTAVASWGRGDDASAPPGVDAAVVPGQASRAFSFASLGLLDQDGRPVPALVALGSLVRDGGTSAGEMRDAGFLALGGVLTQLIGIIDEPPLDFHDGRWLAQFEILPQR